MNIFKENISISITVVALFLVAPVVLYGYETTAVVLADIVVVFGFCVFVIRVASFEGMVLSTSIVLALLSWLGPASQFGMTSFYTLGSLLFFFKPCFAYFAAHVIIRERKDQDFFIFYFLVFSCFVLFGMLYSIIFNYGLVFRAESELQVTLYGLPVFGVYGVNSLAVFIAMWACISLYPFSVKIGLFARICFLFVFVTCSVLTVISLSREAILGLLVMVVCYAFFNRYGFRLVASILICLTLLSPIVVNSEMFEAKLIQIQEGYETGDLDHISSGRISLYKAALQDIYDSPLTGTAFKGFGVGNNHLEQFADSTGLSPHNNYITAFWKGGVGCGIFYILFIFIVTKNSIKNSSGPQKRWLIAIFVSILGVWANLWDVLMIPNFGALFFFLCGVFSKVFKS